MNTISRKILYTVSTGGLLNKNLNVTVNHLKWISFLLLFRGALVLPLKVAPLFSNIQLTVFNIFVHLVSRGRAPFGRHQQECLFLVLTKICKRSAGSEDQKATPLPATLPAHAFSWHNARHGYQCIKRPLIRRLCCLFLFCVCLFVNFASVTLHQSQFWFSVP